MERHRYDKERDLAAITRIWREIAWLDSDDQMEAMEHFLSDTDCWVALIDGEAECAVMNSAGLIRYEDSDLDLSIISGVTTSLIGRKQGLATRLTAHAVAEAAQTGAKVSILGMFEQGFYNLLGFGSGSYEHHLRFDPASLAMDLPYRRPVRLTRDDWEEIHNAVTRRMRSHGEVVSLPVGFTRLDLMLTEAPFGLGYRNDAGELTHFIWGRSKGEHGPYRVGILSYQDHHQLLELLCLVGSLGDQVRLISITEPPGIQLQDLLRHRVRQLLATAKSEYEFRHDSGTWWQVRILDLESCVAARSYDGAPVSFVLELSDPITKYLDDQAWRGVAGSYVVTIGEVSTVTPGADDSLPVLQASVNAFSRLWLGVRPATGLSVTDSLSAPPELIADLDRAFASLPQPHPGMFF